MKNFLVICLLMGAVSVAITGCGAMVVGGHDSSGQEVTKSKRTLAEISRDNRITNSVNSIYVKDAQVNAMDISVRTYRGVVTLRGHVHSQVLAQRAVRLATNVAGVNKVVSRLEVLAH